MKRLSRRGCLLALPPAVLGALGLGAIGGRLHDPILQAYQWYSDNEPPKVTLQVPSAPVKGTTTIGVTVDDPNRWKLLSVRLDTIELDPVPGERQINTANLPDGLHIFQVRAADLSRNQNVGVAEALFVSRNNGPKVELAPESKKIGQGETLLIQLLSDEPATVTGTLDTMQLAFVNEGASNWALAGIDNLARTGNRTLSVVATDGLGNQTRVSFPISVDAKKYPVEEVWLPPSSEGIISSPTNGNEIARLDALFAKQTPQKRWNGTLAIPVKANLLSDFGTGRSYNGGPVTSRHWGADFDCLTGTLVTAPAPGIVAMADNLAVRGNVVILDHGLGVYSCHYHLSRSDVQVGQEVKTGDRLGLSGATGAVTGPHLHWELRVRGNAVDPMPWTKRPYP